MPALTLEQMRAAMAARKQNAVAVSETPPEREAVVPITSQNGASHALPPASERPTDEPLPEERGSAQPPPERSSWNPERPARTQSQDILRQPPHSSEAEQGVLGSMMIEPKWAIPLALEKISARHLYIPAHQLVFDAMVELYTTEGSFDLITFTQYLRDVGHLETVGGPGFVTGLFTFIPTAANISYYISILVDKFALRQIITEASEQVRRAYEEQDDVPGLLREFSDRAERAVRTAQGGTRLPELDDMALLVGDKLPPKPAELVRGILHQGSKLIVGGTSKGRKTFALMDLAISVATGKPWWGFETVQGPVCYINFEIQTPFFAGRKDDICRAKQVVLPTDKFIAWNLRGHGEGIENLIEELLFVLRRRDYALIVIDPIYKALGSRDENKAGDVASMLNALEKISVRTGAAVAFGAHYSKGNQAAKESIDRIGGSGVFARDPDAILTMTAHAEENNFVVEPTLRNFAPIDPFVLKWEWPVFSRTQDLDPSDLKQPRKANSGQWSGQYPPTLLLDELSVIHGERPSTIYKRLSESSGISRSQFYKVAKSLRDNAKLTEKDGLWYRSSDPQNTPK